MRIGFVTTHLPYPANRNGVTVISYHVLVHLAKRHQVTLYALEQNAEAQSVFEGMGMTVKTFAPPKRNRLTYMLLPFRREPWFFYQWNSKELLATLRRVTRMREHDVLVLHGPFLAPYVQQLGLFPIVLNVIDALSLWFAQAADSKTGFLERRHIRREMQFATRLESHLFPKAKKVIVVSEEDKRVLERRSLRTRVQVIANGVDTAKFTVAPQPPQQPCIVFSGSMDFGPNIEAVRWFAHNVWPLVHEAMPQLHWTIAGRNPDAEIRALQSESVTVTGEVDDLAAELRKATVYIAPVLNRSGVKNKVLEAMACGLPIVATPQAAGSLPVEPGRELTLATGSQEFADAVIRLLHNDRERRVLGKNARAFAEAHDWTMVAAQYEKAYQETA